MDEDTLDEQIRYDATLRNAMTGMGTDRDRVEYTIPGLVIRWPKNIVENIAGVPIINRIVTARPKSASVKGWRLSLGTEEDKNKKNKLVREFQKEQKRLRVKEHFFDAQTQANIYGGAVIIMVVEDGQPATKPVNTKRIKRIDRLMVLDRWKIQPFVTTGYSAVDPEFYQLILPDDLLREFADVVDGASVYLIHKSRVLRFDSGNYATPDQMKFNQGWGHSMIDTLWEEYRDWKTGLKASGAILQDASVFVYKLKGLAKMVKDQEVNLLKDHITLLRMMTSVFGGLAVDADGEAIDFPSRNVSGVSDINREQRDSFIGATGIPHDRLFGESPSGLGATGESEENNWANDVREFQETEWKPKLEVLGRYIFLSQEGPTKGQEPDEWDLIFPSIKHLSEEEEASLRGTQATTDTAYLQAGVVTPEEIRNSRFGSTFSMETNLDAKAWAKFQKQQQQAQQQQSGFGDDDDDSADTEGEDFEDDDGDDGDDDGGGGGDRGDSSFYGNTLLQDIQDRQEITRPKRVIHWNNVPIGITHAPGDKRFSHGKTMLSSYGHIRGSYGDAPDGKAFDVYVNEKNLTSAPNGYKVRQIHPDTGMVDEPKYFLGFNSPQEVKQAFVYHAGLERFGGVEPVGTDEFKSYRQDGVGDCGCGVKIPDLENGTVVVPIKLENLSDTEVLRVVETGFPEGVVNLDRWQTNQKQEIFGQFTSPYGVYNFGIKPGMQASVLAYQWAGETKTDSLVNAPPGYHWVYDHRVKGGKYLRKTTHHSALHQEDEGHKRAKSIAAIATVSGVGALAVGGAAGALALSQRQGDPIPKPKVQEAPKIEPKVRKKAPVKPPEPPESPPEIFEKPPEKPPEPGKGKPGKKKKEKPPEQPPEKPPEVPPTEIAEPPSEQKDELPKPSFGEAIRRIRKQKLPPAQQQQENPQVQEEPAATIEHHEQRFKEAAKNLKLKKSQLEEMGKSVNTQQQAAVYKRLKEVDIPKAEAELRESEKALKQAKAGNKAKFKKGNPVKIGDLDAPLSVSEQELANSDKHLNFALKPHEAVQLPQNHYLRQRYENEVKAYNKAKAIAPDMTPHEFKAINHYTGNGYIGMNGALRGLQVDPTSETAQQQLLQAKIFHQALKKVPTYEGELRRDTRIPTQDVDKYQVGKVVVMHGFTSTSTDLTGKETSNYGDQSKSDVLIGKTKGASAKASKYEELAEKAGVRSLPHEASTQVEYRIQAKSGRIIKDFSKTAKEKEVVLPHKWRGRVTGVEDGENGIKRIHLEEA